MEPVAQGPEVSLPGLRQTVLERVQREPVAGGVLLGDGVPADVLDRDPGLLTRRHRLVEHYDDGTAFQIGEVREWRPPHSLVLSWRMATFAPEQSTEVRVRFEPAAPGEQTRVTVEHIGWDTVPQEHAARHGFPLDAFQHRLAEAWQRHLRALGDRLHPT